MAFTKKNYVDLTGLSTFKSSLLGTVINDTNKTTTSKTATIKAIADYVDSEVGDLSSAVTAELAKKVSSVTYDSTNKKLVYNKGDSTNTDIVTVATLKSAIGNFVKSGSGASAGLVPAPSTTAGTSKYLREDGSWATPPDTDTTYNIATSATLGLVKSQTTGTTSGKDYKIEVSSIDGTMKVNVPWTDTKVTSKVGNTTKAYLVGSTSSSEDTGTLIKDTGVYLDTVAGKLVATSFSGSLSGNASSSTNASYSAKIGSSSSHPAIGSESQPVYVNASGVITAGTALGTMAYEASENYLASSLKGAKNGVASLDASGKVPSSQLPSYVDDVLEYSAKSGDKGFPAKGEEGKIYVDTSSNLTYRWSGSAYVEISPSLALGETSSTAYAGDKGKTLAANLSNHTGNTSNPHSVTKAQVGLGNVDNTSDADKPISTATQTALDDKAPLVHSHSYAGSSSVGGSATSAEKLNTNAGSKTEPVYFANGKPTSTGYSFESTVSTSSNTNKIPTSAAIVEYVTSLDSRTYANNFLNKNMFSYGSTVTGSSSAGSYSNGTVTMGDGTINVPNGGIVAGSGIKGAKVYNAVWNDLVDCIPVDKDVELEYGYCYSFDGQKYYKSSEYMEQGVIGIHSDTAGMVMGSKPNTKELHCGVAGFCLAYVDKEYPVGTPLTCTKGGILTEIKHNDKVEYPERVIATYWKSEPSETWGSDTEKIIVNGRRWVKIR